MSTNFGLTRRHAQGFLSGHTSGAPGSTTTSATTIANAANAADKNYEDFGGKVEGVTEFGKTTFNFITTASDPKADPYDIASQSLDLVSNIANMVGPFLGPEGEVGALVISSFCSMISTIIGAAKPKEPSPLEIMGKAIMEHVDQAFKTMKNEIVHDAAVAAIGDLLRECRTLKETTDFFDNVEAYESNFVSDVVKGAVEFINETDETIIKAKSHLERLGLGTGTVKVQDRVVTVELLGFLASICHYKIQAWTRIIALTPYLGKEEDQKAWIKKCRNDIENETDKFLDLGKEFGLDVMTPQNRWVFSMLYQLPPAKRDFIKKILFGDKTVTPWHGHLVCLRYDHGFLTQKVNEVVEPNGWQRASNALGPGFGLELGYRAPAPAPAPSVSQFPMPFRNIIGGRGEQFWFMIRAEGSFFWFFHIRTGYLLSVQRNDNLCAELRPEYAVKVSVNAKRKVWDDPYVYICELILENRAGYRLSGHNTPTDTFLWEKPGGWYNFFLIYFDEKTVDIHEPAVRNHPRYASLVNTGKVFVWNRDVSGHRFWTKEIKDKLEQGQLVHYFGNPNKRNFVYGQYGIEKAKKSKIKKMFKKNDRKWFA